MESPSRFVIETAAAYVAHWSLSVGVSCSFQYSTRKARMSRTFDWAVLLGFTGVVRDRL
jgi:hypothetical protein